MHEDGRGGDQGSPALRTQDDVRSRDLDRRLDELSGELRLLMPATTVLVAFLLTVPFQSGWQGADGTSRGAYVVAFLSSVSAVVFFGGVTAYHRVRGYPYDKEGLLRTANHQAVAGIVLLAVALGAATSLVMQVLFDDAVAVGVTAGLALLTVVTWVVLPLSRRRGRRRLER